MNDKAENLIKALQRNNIIGIYAPTKADVQKQVKEMLFDGCVITAGGSVSLAESGVAEIIRDKKYNFLDRSRKDISEQERLEVYKSVVGSDFYFCSSNALTENGELVNVDGNGNRVAAISFGPQRVIMVVGMNKVVKNLDEALLRIKRIAAPKNCVRLGIDSPCSKLGSCISLTDSSNPDMTDGCACDYRICSQYLVSGYQRIKNRITVILCGEDLGY